MAGADGLQGLAGDGELRTNPASRIGSLRRFHRRIRERAPQKASWTYVEAFRGVRGRCGVRIAGPASSAYFPGHVLLKFSQLWVRWTEPNNLRFRLENRWRAREIA
jgi:hypothetical protein